MCKLFCVHSQNKKIPSINKFFFNEFFGWHTKYSEFNDYIRLYFNKQYPIILYYFKFLNYMNHTVNSTF